MNSIQLPSTQFDITSTCIKLRHKLHCGDSFKAEYIESESLLIAMVCDGVGSRPSDHIASQTVCESFIPLFQKYTSANTLADRITKTIEEVNVFFLSTEGKDKGMLTTLSLVVCDLLNNIFYSVNIGDSRTYIVNKNQLVQYTKDEIKSVILKDKSGKPLTQGGYSISANGITNTIGNPSLKISIKEKALEGITAFILATDGFYSCKASLDQDIMRIVNSTNPEGELDEIMKEYAIYQKDDMTVLIISKGTGGLNTVDFIDKLEDESFDEIILSYSLKEIGYLLTSQLKNSIRSQNDSVFLKLITLLDKTTIDLGRNEYIELFKIKNEANNNSVLVHQQLYNKMKKSRHD